MIWLFGMVLGGWIAVATNAESWMWAIALVVTLFGWGFFKIFKHYETTSFIKSIELLLFLTLNGLLTAYINGAGII